MTAALALIALAALAALLLGVAARAGRDMNLEQWAVGGRGFGWIFVFLLLAGEIYTTFTFLGASGFSTAGSSGLLHPGLRLARLRNRLFPAAPNLELCQAERPALAAGFLPSANTRARRSACWSQSSIWWR